MPNTIALTRYLERHISGGLPDAPADADNRWQHCLVIPAYDESPLLLDRLTTLSGTAPGILVILVLNRPDSDPGTQKNNALRTAIHCVANDAAKPDHHGILVKLAAGVDLLLFDLELVLGPCPAAQGVGLARKYGCDLALKWIRQGAIATDWLCSSDADARLPPDYFQRLARLPASAIAASLPFYHRAGDDPACNRATALYELRLHHYVLGLEYAGSPYAYHTLGSTLAVRTGAYAAVRGFPRRAGGEDFYLLNKLAKVGPIARPAGDCIELDSRPSHRVPFGTGPAVTDIAAAKQPDNQPLFYHPMCFLALRTLLETVPLLWEQRTLPLAGLLGDRELDAAGCELVATIMQRLGLDAALQHCYRQSKTGAQFQRQFHQWFDGFRSLKFIHAVRDSGWPDQPLSELAQLTPWLWPASSDAATDVEILREAVRAHLGWRLPVRTEPPG